MKCIILPSFFAYCFDSSIQWHKDLMELIVIVIRQSILPNYFKILTQMKPCQLRDTLLMADFIFLLQSSCNLYPIIREISFEYLHKYSFSFPFILQNPRVLFVYLDIIGTLYNELFSPYDSCSHILRLPHSNIEIILPVDKAQKQNSFVALIKLLEELFMKAMLLNEAELIGVFQEYTHKTISSKSTDSLSHFGISFLQNLYYNFMSNEKRITEKVVLDYVSNVEALDRNVKKMIKESNSFFNLW